MSADIDLWATKTWTMFDTLTSVTGTAVGDVSMSPDGQRVAVGNYDGTGGVWSLIPDEELVPLAGQTADLNTISFSPNGDRCRHRCQRRDGPDLSIKRAPGEPR